MSTFYPPGVMTGRPLELFEATPTLDLYAVPEQWVVREGDLAILEEICDSFDKRHDEEMQRIQEQLVLIGQHHDEDEYYVYPMVPQFASHPFSHNLVPHFFRATSLGIKEALLQFEEDFDYEQSLWGENKGCEEQQINLHRLLACADVTKRPGWCGSEDLDAPDGTRLIKERYTWDVTMITSFPEIPGPPVPPSVALAGARSWAEASEICARENKRDPVKAYALGKTPYGLVFFPEKFRKYVPPVGETQRTTVALKKIGSDKGDRSFTFTAIYLH